MLSRKTIVLWLLLITGLAFVLRFLAVKPGYPPNHPDEPVVYSVAAKMVREGSLNPHRFDYPAFSMVVNAFFYRTFFMPLELTKIFISRPLTYLKNLGNFDHFLRTYVLYGRIDPVLFWGRYLSAIFGTLTVLALYFLAKEAFGELVGLISAFLLAFNYRHLISSVLTLPGVFGAFILVISFWLFLLLLRQPTRKKYFLSGVLIGLALATKYLIMILLPFLLVHFLIALRAKSPQDFLKKIFVPEAFLAAIACIFTFFLINPYVLIDLEEAIRWILWDGSRYEAGVISLRLAPLWYLYEYVLTKPLSWAAIGGAVLGLIKRQYRLPTFLFLSFLGLVFFILLIYTHGAAYGRNFTEPAPFILIFAALLIVEISRKNIIVAGLLTVLLGFFSIKNTVTTSYFLSKDWPLNCVTSWVLKNLPATAKVGIAVPVPMEGLSARKANWVFFEDKTDFTLKEVQKAKTDYLIINLAAMEGGSVSWSLADNLFWEMPTDIFDNSLNGLVVNQLSRYSVETCLKPSLIPGHNFLIIKVPSPPKSVTTKLIKTYDFDAGAGQYSPGWQVMVVRPSTRWRPEGFSWERGNVCKKGGCLKAAVGSSYLFKQARFVSEAIPVEPGKKYVIEGWLKSAKPLLAEERNGFIRIDFYEDEKMTTAARGIIAAVSDRIGGEDLWQKKMVEEVAPARARFARISLQHEGAPADIYFDEVRIYEAQSTPEEIKAANSQEVGREQRYPKTIF